MNLKHVESDKFQSESRSGVIIFSQKVSKYADQIGAFDHLTLSLGHHGWTPLSMMLAGRTCELRAQAAPQMTPPLQCRSQAAPQCFATGRIGKQQSPAWGASRTPLQAKRELA